MKPTTLKAASIAALALLCASSVPLVHAQNIGDFVKKAKKKMGDAVGDNGGTSKGEAPARSDDAPPRMDGQPSTPTGDSSTPSGEYNGPSYIKVSEQLVASLRKIAPKNTQLMIVGCQPNAAGSFTYKGVYLVKSAGHYRSGNLAAIPASTQSQFATLRRAEQGGGHPFDACKITIPFGLSQTFGDENDGRFDYYYKGAREMGKLETDDVSHFKIPTATQLLAVAQKSSARVDTKQKAEAATVAKETRRVAKAHTDAARRAGHGDLTWVCTQCHHTYRWPEKPDGYDTGACQDSSSGRHNWVRK